MNINWNIVASCISALATIILAIIAGIEIKENSRLRKRETKIFQLKEILDWIVDVNNSSFIDTPKDDFRTQQSFDAWFSYHRQMNRARALTKGEMISSLVALSYKELSENVKEVMKDLVVESFLEMVNVKAGFRGELLNTIEEIEARLQKETKDAIFLEYAVKLADSTHQLSENTYRLILKL
jgi:hypothetical protein